MPKIYLVEALSPRLGLYIHQTGYAGASLPSLVRYLLEGRLGRDPIQRVFCLDTDTLSASSDASEAVLVFLDAEAERLNIEIPHHVHRWMTEHAARKAQACRAAMAPLQALFRNLGIWPHENRADVLADYREAELADAQSGRRDDDE